MKSSPYIHWAKTRFNVRYNLARSGITALPLEDLNPTLEQVLGLDPHGDGWPPLIERVASRYGVKTASVAIAHGASMANHLACATLLEPGDEVIVESPVYEPLLLVPKYLRAHVRLVQRREDAAWALDVDAVANAITQRTRLIILTNLHNPTGALNDHDSLLGLAELADTHGCHVLIDEVYLEFLYPDGVHTGTMISPWFITTRSLTKAYGLGSLRVGWILAKPSIAERMRRLHDLFMAEVSHPAERLAAIALDRADELLAPAVATLNTHIERVDAFVTAHEKLRWVRPDAGTVGFVHLSGGGVDEMVERLAARHDTLVTPGRFFGAQDYFRIGWGVDSSVLEEGLRRLVDTIDRM